MMKTMTEKKKTKKKPLDLEAIRKRLKKSNKRVKALEAEVEELKEQVRLVDQRTIRMTTALRQCMQKLGVKRPEHQ